jgi:hypothetical protein
MVEDAPKLQLLTYLSLTGMHLVYLLNLSESLIDNGVDRMINRLVE